MSTHGQDDPLSEMVAPDDIENMSRDQLLLTIERLTRERDVAIQERDAVVQERDAIVQERDAAIQERDAVVQEREEEHAVLLAALRTLYNRYLMYQNLSCRRQHRLTLSWLY